VRDAAGLSDQSVARPQARRALQRASPASVGVLRRCCHSRLLGPEVFTPLMHPPSPGCRVPVTDGRAPAAEDIDVILEKVCVGVNMCAGLPTCARAHVCVTLHVCERSKCVACASADTCLPAAHTRRLPSARRRSQGLTRTDTAPADAPARLPVRMRPV
jgi:hypothetical protein